jgi:hypothetical protein
MSVGFLSVDDRLIRRREAASMLGLKCQTLARWAMTGKHLRIYRIGRTVRYKLGDINRLISEGNGTL